MILRADARRLPLADGVAHCCVTSPPYWNLRDYGHGDQIGLEESPDAYVAQIVEVFREVRRVLRDDGTAWVNLGDTYFANGGHTDAACNDRRGAYNIGNRPEHNRREKRERHAGAVRAKNLVGIPWRVAFALQADGWILRSDIVWHKPNPMPESVTDRPTKAHEYLFLLAKSDRYYYDADAIKERASENTHARGAGVNPKASNDRPRAAPRERPGQDSFNRRYRVKQNASFSAAVSAIVPERNKRSVWTVAPEPFPGAHFAVMPPALVVPCVLAGSPVGGLVVDPFGGTGTVGRVAEDLGRRWIVSDLSTDYTTLARRRLAQVGLLGRLGA